MTQTYTLSGEQKVAVITGSARRIGRAVAKTLHELGFDLILHYRNSHTDIESVLKELNQKRPNSAISVAGDLTQADHVQRLAIEISSLSSNLSVLINNASLFSPDSELENKEDAWHDMLQVNAHTSYQLAHAFREQLLQNEGCIINFVDIYSERPLKGHTIYSASKAAQAMMVKSLALEFAPDIRVNGISPGAIMWPEHQKDDTDYHKQLLARIPLNRLGQTDDICAAIKFILECKYLHGQILNIDGGRSIQI